MFNSLARACFAGGSKASCGRFRPFQIANLIRRARAEPRNSPLEKGRTPKVGVAQYYSVARGRNRA